MRVGVRPSSPDQSLTLPELRPTFGRKLLDRERGSARHCGLNLLAHLSLGRSGTPLRGGGVLFRHAASLSGMSQLTVTAHAGAVDEVDAKRFYRQRHKIENFFCRVKDWRRIATRYDKLARNFLAATLMIGTLYWIKL